MKRVLVVLVALPFVLLGLVLAAVFLWLIAANSSPVVVVACVVIMALLVVWFFFVRPRAAGVVASEGSLMGRQSSKDGLL